MPYKSEKIRLPQKYDRRRKLTDDKKEEIRQQYSTGNISLKNLADKYNVSKKTILLIVNPESKAKSDMRVKEHWRDYQRTTEERNKAASKPVATSNGSIYVQFGSYGTRAAAQAAEQKLRASHSSLFSGKQFVILAANVKGQTTYRLRVAFQNSNDANGFCRNAKSDGLDCYVTK